MPLLLPVTTTTPNLAWEAAMAVVVRVRWIEEDEW